MCTRYPIINRVSELKVHIELTRFVQPEKSKLMQTKGQLMKSLHTAFSFAPPSILSLTICIFVFIPFCEILWTTHCLKPMGFLLRRPRNLLSPQALIRTVPVLYCYSFYAICLNPSSSIFFAALISLSWFVPQTGHIHSLTDRFFVSVFWYPQAEHSWLLA